MQKTSIIIPTLGRGEALRKCLKSLDEQTVKPCEIITVTEKGELAHLRNQGASKGRGDILIFIDDDVITTSNWLYTILNKFSDPLIAGVSGPAIIRQEIRRNRDIFKYRMAKILYDKLFCEGRESLPGHIMRSGAWTTGASLPICNYEGQVDFLEACNMAWRREVFNEVGGFDEAYKGVGDWSEPDLAFRVRRAGYKLWFSRDARVYHEVSRDGAFKYRATDSANRLRNYELFSSRYIKPCFRHSLYKLFLRSYYAFKAFE